MKRCPECGSAHTAKGAFCAEACRTVFNNRRKERGAELYDLFMAFRWERELAATLGIFQAICRLASNWRQEDRERRDGRKSWRHPRIVLEERPYLKAIFRRDYTGRRAA